MKYSLNYRIETGAGIGAVTERQNNKIAHKRSMV